MILGKLARRRRGARGDLQIFCPQPLCRAAVSKIKTRQRGTSQARRPRVVPATTEAE